ncbi:MAG: ISL3 family transposase [Actinomycetes bacterium]|nr:MAG: ISL3 family transposase [Actinomycetes bacterium]
MQEQVSRVVGLDGFEVRAVVEDGEQLDLEVELLARAERCPYCSSRELEIHERPVVRVRDLDCGGRRTSLRWRKRRYRCRACRRTHTESHDQVPARGRLPFGVSGELACCIPGLLEVVSFDTHSLSAGPDLCRHGVRNVSGLVSYQVAQAMRIAAQDTIAGRPTGLPRALSFDEAAHRKGSRNLATIVSDLDRKAVHEVLDGRSRPVVERYLRSISKARRERVELVCIDPWEPYRLAVHSQLPDARIVCDPFHVVRGAGEALDTVRRSRQRLARKPKGKHGRRESWRPELYRARHTLLRARERLSERQRRRLCELFAADPLIAEAWGLKEALRAVYAAVDRAEAELRLDLFFAAVGRSALQPFEAYAKGIASWREEILAYFDEPASNGYAEGVINKVKVIKRRAYGLPSFAGFRERVLLACG